MDTFYQAVSLFRRRNYDQCIEICNLLLMQKQHTLHQGRAWELKMRAMTQRVYVDEIEVDDGIAAETALDILATAKTGTSFKTATGMKTATGLRTATARNRTSTRPFSTSGRPISGMSRPGTFQEKPGTSRLGNRTARLATAASRQNSAVNIRLGSASMYAFGDPSGPMIHLSRFHAAQYADKNSVTKPLFQYLYYHEGDIAKALQLCDAVINSRKISPGWWWHTQKGRCLLQQNKPKLAEEHLRLSLSQMAHPDTALLLSRCFTKMAKPEEALTILDGALEKLPNEISLLTQQARILEYMNDMPKSVKLYKTIGQLEAMNTEALACVAVHYFYDDQPEIALLYYRRILSMGAHSAELYCNIGLCCLYGGQLDLVLYCFQRALRLATSNTQRSEVWYNISFVGLHTGDLLLMKRSLRLCVSYDGSHSDALNNLAVLAAKGKQFNKAKQYLVTAQTANPKSVEIEKNLEAIEQHL